MPVGIKRTSILDGKEYVMSIELTAGQLRELQSPNRRAIQDVCPELTAGEREFLITGITPEEWARVFGSGEEDE